MIPRWIRASSLALLLATGCTADFSTLPSLRSTGSPLNGLPGNALAPDKLGQIDPVAGIPSGEQAPLAASWARNVTALFDSNSGPVLENDEGIWRISRGMKQLLADRLPPADSRKAYAFTPDGKHGWAVGAGLYSWDATRSTWMKTASTQLAGRKLLDVAVQGDGEDFSVMAVGMDGCSIMLEPGDGAWQTVDVKTETEASEETFSTVRWGRLGEAWVGGSKLWHLHDGFWSAIPLPGPNIIQIRSIAPGSHGNVHAVLVNEARHSRGGRDWSGDTLATWTGTAWTQTFLPARTGVGDPQIVQLATAGDLGLAIERGAPGGRLFRYTDQEGWRILDKQLPDAYLDSLVFSDSAEEAYALDISEQRVWRLNVTKLSWSLLGER